MHGYKCEDVLVPGEITRRWHVAPEVPAARAWHGWKLLQFGWLADCQQCTWVRLNLRKSLEHPMSYVELRHAAVQPHDVGYQEVSFFHWFNRSHKK